MVITCKTRCGVYTLVFLFQKNNNINDPFSPPVKYKISVSSYLHFEICAIHGMSPPTKVIIKYKLSFQFGTRH